MHSVGYNVTQRPFIAHYLLKRPNKMSFLPARRYASAGNSDRNVSVWHEPVLCQNEEIPLCSLNDGSSGGHNQHYFIRRLKYASTRCSSYDRVELCKPTIETIHRNYSYLKTPTLLCFIKSPLTVVMSCISFCRHFRRPHKTIVCVIELISSACRTTPDALWIVTFLLGNCLGTFINSF